MEQESCGRNHEAGVIKEEHGGRIMEEQTWRSNHGAGNIQETWKRNDTSSRPQTWFLFVILEEECWRRNHRKEIIGEEAWMRTH